MYDLGDRLLMVASDRISTYDVVHPTPIPDKGKVLTGLSAFWFEQIGRRSCPTTSCRSTDGVPDEVRGRALAVRKLEMLPVECVVRGYITGLGLEGLPGDRRRSRDRAARRAAGVRAAARADLHAVDEGRRRPRRDDRLRRRPPTIVGDRDADGAAARRCRSRCTRSPPTHAARARRDPRRHEVRVRPRRRRRAARRRRGADARLVALLAGRRLRARARRSRASTSSTCATGRPAPAGTRSRRRRRSPTTSSRARARSTSRPTRRSPASSFDAWLARAAARECARASWSARRPASSTRRASPSSARCRRWASRASRTSTSAG